VWCHPKWLKLQQSHLHCHFIWLHYWQHIAWYAPAKLPLAGANHFTTMSAIPCYISVTLLQISSLWRLLCCIVSHWRGCTGLMAVFRWSCFTIGLAQWMVHLHSIIKYWLYYVYAFPNFIKFFVRSHCLLIHFLTLVRRDLIAFKLAVQCYCPLCTAMYVSFMWSWVDVVH